MHACLEGLRFYNIIIFWHFYTHFNVVFMFELVSFQKC